MPAPVKKITIIGGGITGLAAALRIQEKAAKSDSPLTFELLEASPRLGGTLHTTSRNGFLLEGGPDCFLSSKPRAIEFCNELGLGSELIETLPDHRQSFIVKGGKLFPIPKGFYLLGPSQLRPFLASPLLSWNGKIRALLEPFIPAYDRGNDGGSDESLASFVRRRMGQDVLDWLAQPLIAGIYAANPESLSLQSTFPQFLEMEKKYGSVLLGLSKRDADIENASGARYSLFVTLRHGMESLVTKISEKLPKNRVRLQCRVKTVQRREEGWSIFLESGETLETDAVCLCLSAEQSARLLSVQDCALAEQLAAIPYTTSVTVNLAFDQQAIRHPMDGMGFVTPLREGAPALACTFVHRKFAGRAPDGQALLRAFVGGHGQEEFLQNTDNQITDIVLQQLRALLGISGEPRFVSIERWPQAMPQYNVGHLKRVLAIEEAVFGLPGLALAGNWQYGVGIPDCIQSGIRAVEQLQRPSTSNLRVM